ncbi:MAG: hypothetical protein JSV50_02770, partial [Desulfobacteraceae bacterium]
RARGDIFFRLQRYEIIRKTDSQIVWKTHAGPNTVSGGTCIILEDVLFIGPRQNELSTLNKRQFLSNLQQLPKWVQTRYFCSRLSLHDCKTGNRVQEERKRWPSERTATETHDARKGYKNSTEFKLKKSDLSENPAMFFTHWVRKFITYAVALILLIISLFFAYLIRYWKELKGRWHYKKGKRSTIHHKDD